MPMNALNACSITALRAWMLGNNAVRNNPAHNNPTLPETSQRPYP